MNITEELYTRAAYELVYNTKGKTADLLVKATEKHITTLLELEESKDDKKRKVVLDLGQDIRKIMVEHSDFCASRDNFINYTLIAAQLMIKILESGDG